MPRTQPRLFSRTRKTEFAEPGIPKPVFHEFPLDRDFHLYYHGRHSFNGRVSVKTVITGVLDSAHELLGDCLAAALLVPGSQLEKRIGPAAAARLVGRLVSFAEIIRALGISIEEETGSEGSEPDYEPDFQFDPQERLKKLRRKDAAQKRKKLASSRT